MLSKIYADYIRNGAGRSALEPLGDALAEAGLVSEGEVLARHAVSGASRVECESGMYTGRTLFVGPRPPAAAVYGDYWLDSCELSVLVLLPFYVDPDDRPLLSDEARVSVEEQRSWFALHPVRWFQFRAFLDVAPLEPSRGAFDRARLSQGADLDPVTHVTCSEAGLYLYWFGTAFSNENMWLSAREHLNIAPWAVPAREWVGESYFDDQYEVAISPNTLEIDPQATEEVDDDEMRMLYLQNDAPANVTFRSSVHMVYGLDHADIPSMGGYAGRVLGRFHRPK